MKEGLSQSFIEIEIYQNTPYYAGGELKGSIHVYAHDNINNVGYININFTGKEYVIWNKKIKKGSETFSFENTVINRNFKIYDFDDFHNVIMKGCYTFPFTLYLPETLPQTNLCYDTQEDEKKLTGPAFEMVNTTRVSYTLTAEVRGMLNPLLANLKTYKDPLVDDLTQTQRMTILIPEVFQAIKN